MIATFTAKCNQTACMKQVETVSWCYSTHQLNCVKLKITNGKFALDTYKRDFSVQIVFGLEFPFSYR